MPLNRHIKRLDFLHSKVALLATNRQILEGVGAFQIHVVVYHKIPEKILCNA